MFRRFFLKIIIYHLTQIVKALRKYMDLSFSVMTEILTENCHGDLEVEGNYLIKNRQIFKYNYILEL